MSTEDLRQALRPHRYIPVRELVEAAGVDVRDWAFDRHGKPIDNPNENVYRSFMWSFGGGGQPTVLCLWYEEIDWSFDAPTYAGNTKSLQAEIDRLGRGDSAPAEKQRLQIKLKRARAFRDLIYKARLNAQPIRAVLLAGRRVDAEHAATDSSKVAARLLDDAPWFVHEFDPYTESYRLVRGVPAPSLALADPYADLFDPAADEDFQHFVGNLDESVREALIKVRVGQGPFRDALMKRWGGCSVTNCRRTDLLIASHIKPWSQCETLHERLGPSNGLLLTPNLDRAFDRGLISFDERFKILISPSLPDGVAMQIGIDRNMRLGDARGDDLLPYMQWHREHLFGKSHQL